MDFTRRSHPRHCDLGLTNRPRFLTLPASPTLTFDTKGLSSLQTSVTRTNLSDTINSFPDVVNLAPNNQAFLSAGSPETNLDISALESVLLFHVLRGPGYTPEYHDGQIVQSINNQSIRVTKGENGTTYFN